MSHIGWLKVLKNTQAISCHPCALKREKSSQHFCFIFFLSCFPLFFSLFLVFFLHFVNFLINVSFLNHFSFFSQHHHHHRHFIIIITTTPAPTPLNDRSHLGSTLMSLTFSSLLLLLGLLAASNVQHNVREHSQEADRMAKLGAKGIE